MDTRSSAVLRPSKSIWFWAATNSWVARSSSIFSSAGARLVAFDLMKPRAIADDLIQKAVRLARLQDCGTLRLVRPLDTPSDTLALVLASGVADLHSVF